MEKRFVKQMSFKSGEKGWANDRWRERRGGLWRPKMMWWRWGEPGEEWIE